MISAFALKGALELGLCYSIMAMGLYISYRILDVADLTVDGSFTLGAAVSAVLCTAGHPVLALVMALIAGALAGGITAILQTVMGVQPILAGILVMSGLYSVNLTVMGDKPNISLLGENTVFSLTESILGGDFAKLLLSLLAVIAVIAFIVLFFKTHLGLCVRATGDNEAMVRSSSINVRVTKFVGLSIANALVALSGGLIAQMQRFSDSGMGIGMVVIGLASIIIGEVVVKRGSVLRCVLGVLCGSVVYRLIIAVVLELGLPQSALKLISSGIVAAAVSAPAIKRGMALYLKRKGANVNAGA